MGIPLEAKARSNYLERLPIKVEIVTDSENADSLNRELESMTADSSISYGYTGYISNGHATEVIIECIVDESDKEKFWDLLRFKEGRKCRISSEPSW